MLDLSGNWSLADAGGEFTAPMRVPGDVHSALVEAGRIPDPYHGRNEYDLRWIADRDWTLSRSFELADVSGPWLLAIDMLDTVAEVRLNGRTVLEAATSFREHVAPVAEALVAGTNTIEIVLRSNTRTANERQAAQPFPIPYQASNCPIPNGNMLRKPQCDFGWDWNIALAPLGVYGRIALIDGAGEIAGALIRQTHAQGRVTLDVEVRLRGLATAAADWHVALGAAADTGTATLANGAGHFSARLELDAPALWWPAGSGDQPIHDLVVTTAGLTRRFQVALRDIRLVSEPDATGRSFKLVVNGRDTFARGANWIPADALAGRITETATRDLLESAVAANMNMLRVWGGGRYEPASFYEACDDLGLMVWQDFMFACHLYPSTDEFLSEVTREVAFQTRRLAHHIALWCGDNELLGALTWFEESRSNRDRYLVAYDRLNRTIEQALKAADPTANWWPSSPSPGPMSFGDTWHDDTSGDMHFWSVWHEGRDFEHYRDVQPRFCSEFGFQSYTSLDVIRSFADEADLNIAAPVMESHQKNAGGNARIAETMFRYFRFPKDFPNFVWLSQVQQGVAIKTAVDYWRSLKPHCMGALYWQLNDTWPVASWSSLDYGGGWKLLHHMARRFFQPATAVVIPTADAFRLVAINDTPDPVGIRVDASAVAMSGALRALKAFPDGSGQSIDVGPDAALEIGTISADALRPDEILAIRWRASTGATGHDHAPPVRYKALDLRDPGLTLATRIEGADVVARIASRALALFVTIEADRPGRFSDNAIALYPARENTEIRFTPADGDPAATTLVVRDLYSSFAT